VWESESRTEYIAINTLVINYLLSPSVIHCTYMRTYVLYVQDTVLQELESYTWKNKMNDPSRDSCRRIFEFIAEKIMHYSLVIFGCSSCCRCDDNRKKHQGVRVGVSLVGRYKGSNVMWNFQLSQPPPEPQLKAKTFLYDAQLLGSYQSALLISAKPRSFSF